MSNEKTHAIAVALAQLLNRIHSYIIVVAMICLSLTDWAILISADPPVEIPTL